MNPTKKLYRVTLFVKNELKDRVVVIPFNTSFRTIGKAMEEVRRAERSPNRYAKAVVVEFDIFKGMKVQVGAPMVHVIDAEALKEEV